MTHIEAMKLAKAWFERNTYGDEAVEEYEALVQAIADAEQPAQHDIPDLIAGALGVSRGTAYDLMREALAEQAQPVAWVTEDGERSITHRQKQTSLRDGGACASTVAPFSVAAFSDPPPRQPLTDAVTKELWHKSRLMTASQTRWQVFKKLIEAAHGITKENT